MISKVINPNNLGSGLRVSFSTVTGKLTLQVVDHPGKAFSLSPEAALELRDLISDFRLEYYRKRKQDYEDCFSLAC